MYSTIGMWLHKEHVICIATNIRKAINHWLQYLCQKCSTKDPLQYNVYLIYRHGHMYKMCCTPFGLCTFRPIIIIVSHLCSTAVKIPPPFCDQPLSISYVQAKLFHSVWIYKSSVFMSLEKVKVIKWFLNLSLH